MGTSLRHDGQVLDPRSPDDHRHDLNGPQFGAASWWTPQRVELHDFLEENAPALAPLYRGALWLAMLDSFPGRVHFVALAIREIRNRLPGALGPKVASRDAGRPGYEGLADKIREQWLAEGLPEDGRLLPLAESTPSLSGPPRREVSLKLLASVGGLVKSHSEAQNNKRTREKYAFDSLSDPGPAPRYVVENWNKLYDDVHGFVHAANEPFAADADHEWVEKFFKFETLLMAISKRSYENLDDLDSLLQRANAR